VVAIDGDNVEVETGTGRYKEAASQLRDLPDAEIAAVEAAVRWVH